MRIKIGPNPSECSRNLPIANIRKKGASISNEAAISLGRGGASDLWIIIKINPVIIATRDNPIRNDLIPSCFQPGGRCEFWYEPLSHLVMVLCIFPDLLMRFMKIASILGWMPLASSLFLLWLSLVFLRLFYGQFWNFQIVVNKNFHKQWAELWPEDGKSYKKNSNPAPRFV